MKCIHKDNPVEANQWFKNGDHPEDDCVDIPGVGMPEGKIVQRARERDGDHYVACQQCRHDHKNHGVLDSGIQALDEFGNKKFHVCPGDWIIKNADGKYFVCTDEEFHAKFDAVTENNAQRLGGNHPPDECAEPMDRAAPVEPVPLTES